MNDIFDDNETMITLLIFILGLCFGSFVNAWVWRTKSGHSIVTGRSMCPHCKHQLAWYDNLPLVSYLVLQAKCRYCHKAISAQYPLVELGTGLLFAALYWHFVPNNGVGWLVLASWCLVSVFMMAAFVYDLHYMQLPDRFMLPAITMALVLMGVNIYLLGWSAVVPQIIATTIFGGLYFGLWFLSGGKFLGDGDIRLAIAMGLLLLVPQLLVAVFTAYLVGALVGVGLIATKAKKRTDPIAFGPFLIIGLYVGLLFGTQISNWYLSLF